MLVIGIASFEETKKRTLAIARGDYKPGEKEPKIWFASLEDLERSLVKKDKVYEELIRAI